ncbi:mannose-1-phosphate guanyltransferase [Clostridium sp. BNL1100]|uniref:mannose-1-phosphate guanyltransferase n=1 Tax=Clostridium sp. BNL1100 TaxID=755731 RepID=UPI00024A7470|nr:Nucleoside-diphosphate-sugar pyrophosphorylase family protein [Clostridium sp. BNL1100]
MRGDSVKAIIMAGGEGSRLRPLTCDLPKPMVPIINKPVLEHTIGLLKSYGITDIGITLLYHPQIIKDYFGNGHSHGVNIYYFLEESPLGTAGGIKNARDFLDETFIVISGDSLTDLDVDKALKYHQSKKSIATLILAKVDVPLEYGVVLTDEDGSVKGFVEKPSWGEIFSDMVNTGIYILEPEILSYIESGKNTDFSRDVFPTLLSSSKKIFGYVTNDYWCDIGDTHSYINSHCDILNGKLKINIGDQLNENVWVGPGTVIDKSARIIPPCVIGSNCKIGSGSVIGSYAVIGNNTIVKNDVSVVRSILWDNCYVENGSELRGAILCNHVNLKNYVSVFENSVIGEGCKINERSIIKPNIRLWPEKVVEPLAIVDRNMIWGSKHNSKIFGENGISGIINVDISPEYATRLGAAYGSHLKTGSKVVVSSTNSNSARMFKHAFISGILSVGIEVFNMSSLLTPISRYAIGFLKAEGGIHIKTDMDNPNLIRVDFMDSRGTSISKFSERKIENSFFREDFKRCSSQQISRLNNITDFSSYYVRNLIKNTNVNAIMQHSPRICIFSKSEFVCYIVGPMLTNMGCQTICYENYSDISSVTSVLVETNCEFGAIIDSNGENLTLISREGIVVKDDLFEAFISLIIFKRSPGTTFYVPITSSDVIERLASRYRCVVKRTKNCLQAVMDEILGERSSSAGSDQLVLNFDAIAGLVKIIEYMCVSGITLNQLLLEIPKIYIDKKSIYCPWELKGMVMRRIINDNKDKKAELLDGIKLYLEDGWVLIIPDADTPAFKIISEGSSAITAKEHCVRFHNIVERIITNS